MLVPAAWHKEAIYENFKKFIYTDDMMYLTGCLETWIPDIPDCPDGSSFQFAIISDDEFEKGEVIGFISYRIDWYSDCAYNFEAISFDRGNPIIGIDIFKEMENL